ncbi:hypothetical protein BBO99_00003568 [Phytophthora kernoviae]|uniref:Uncharacterized protein n=2 Tax=Phytophthora kernoviae TaxID=325452 RepID=A0A3R7FYY3_9STRA|nr:hypothetical protein G195_007097 [Phytophthora kernoviae 00238/432]KAG2529149.1 hypothetical protein JM18_002908 [Phytophthora kernoviae]RLN06466.1 hypothetical protein BBI17_003654 [Phytophthora kernoviae]RLN81606.1 hypothetical protein BBO99_00003568 [Phytophthora kernoviae]
MKQHATKTKRSCPFTGPGRKRRRSDQDLKKLQKDVEELEIRLQAARSRRTNDKAVQEGAQRLQSVLQACRVQAQNDVDMTFGYISGLKCTEQLEYEPSVDAPAFKQLEKNLQDQYDQLDLVFQDAGLNQDKTDYCDAQVVTGGQQGTFVRFSTAKVAPFELDTISGAMWSSAKKHAVLNMSSEDAGCSKSTMYIKRQCMLQHDKNSPDGIAVLLRGVCRRFVEPHRIVLLWEGTGDWPLDYVQRHPSSAPIRERGYCVVQNFHNSKNSRTPLSLFQTCIDMTPGLSAGIAMDQPEHLKMLSDMVIPSYRKLLEAREQLLENAILDEMIHQRMRGAIMYDKYHL